MAPGHADKSEEQQSHYEVASAKRQRLKLASPSHLNISSKSLILGNGIFIFGATSANSVTQFMVYSINFKIPEKKFALRERGSVVETSYDEVDEINTFNLG